MHNNLGVTNNFNSKSIGQYYVIKIVEQYQLIFTLILIFKSITLTVSYLQNVTNKTRCHVLSLTVTSFTWEESIATIKLTTPQFPQKLIMLKHWF